MISETTMTRPRRPSKARAAGTDFRPIADYALLADCNSAALVDRGGSVDWLCLPRYDSRRDLRPHARPRCRPLVDPARWLVLRASAATCPARSCSRPRSRPRPAPSGCVDAMAFAEGQRGHDLGFDAPHELLRSVEGVSGEVELELELAPRPEYGLVRPLIRLEGGGARTFGGPALGLSSSVPLTVDDRMRRSAPPSRSRRASRSGSRCAGRPPSRGSRRRRPRRTRWPSGSTTSRRHGARGRPSTTSTRVPNRELVRVSSRVLKGLTYRPTGAIVAAPTTSLPGDCRRRAQLGLPVLLDPRLEPHARGALHRRLLRRGRGVRLLHDQLGRRPARARDSLQIMYGIGGEHDLSERELPHLRGWRDSAPVRVGNGAWDQVQLDVYGELLNSLSLYQERLGELHPGDPAVRRRPGGHRRARAGRRRTRACGRCAASRGTTCPRRCSAGSPSTAPSSSPASSASTQRPSEWAAERDRIRDAILERGWSERKQAFAQSFDSDELDAAQLLMPTARLPARNGRAHEVDDRRDRRRADRRRSRAALPQQGGAQRGRADRRGGHVHDLLVLARRMPRARPAR